jgi:hypothetical protein
VCHSEINFLKKEEKKKKKEKNPFVLRDSKWVVWRGGVVEVEGSFKFFAN